MGQPPGAHISHDIHIHMLSATEAAALGGQRDMLPMVLALGPVKPPATAVWDLLARAHVHRGEVAEARAALAGAPAEVRASKRPYLKLGLQCAPRAIGECGL